MPTRIAEFSNRKQIPLKIQIAFLECAFFASLPPLQMSTKQQYVAIAQMRTCSSSYYRLRSQILFAHYTSPNICRQRSPGSADVDIPGKLTAAVRVAVKSKRKQKHGSHTVNRNCFNIECVLEYVTRHVKRPRDFLENGCWCDY
jgi:hypothetical protein